MIMYIVQKLVDNIEVDGSLSFDICEMDDLIRIYDGGLVTTINGDFENARWVFKNGQLKSKHKDVKVRIDISSKFKNLSISCGELYGTNCCDMTVEVDVIKNCKFDNCEINLKNANISDCDFNNSQVNISHGVVTKTKFTNCAGFVNMRYDDSVIFDNCGKLYFGGLLR